MQNKEHNVFKFCFIVSTNTIYIQTNVGRLFTTIEQHVGLEASIAGNVQYNVRYKQTTYVYEILKQKDKLYKRMLQYLEPENNVFFPNSEQHSD